MKLFPLASLPLGARFLFRAQRRYGRNEYKKFEHKTHSAKEEGESVRQKVPVSAERDNMALENTMSLIVEDSLPNDILQVLNSMREHRELCDVSLMAENNEIHAHRAILAACSPYFRAMFLSGFAEAKEDKVTLQGVSPAALQQVVDYFYTSELKLETENVEDIIRVAILLRLETIVDHCETFLRRNMSPFNCLGLQSFATLFNLESLSQHAARFTLWHFETVYEEEEFLEMPYGQLKSLIEDDNLKVQCEEKVFEAVWKWVEHDFTKRKVFIPDIMHYVRFPLMSLTYLGNNVSVRRMLKENAVCQELIREAMLYQSSLENQSISDLESIRVRPRMASEEIYVLGGWSNGQKISSVQCFNVDTLQWTVVAGMSVAHVSREDYFRVVAVREELYTVSRYKVGKYDPIANSWIQIANGPDVQCKWAGVCEHDGFIYVVGGHSSMCAKRFDTEMLTWQSLPSMMYARYYPGVAVVRGKVYAVGGLDHLWAPLNTAERYDPQTNQWEAIPSTSTARWSLGVAVVDEMLYAIGGSDNRESCSTSVEVYDPIKNEWNQSVADMNAGRRCLGVAVINDVIYVVGGRVANSIEYYDKESNQWKVVGAVNTRCNFGCVALRIL